MRYYVEFDASGRPVRKIETAEVIGTSINLVEMTEHQYEDYNLTAEQKIFDAKAELAATDYMVIKCAEAQLVGYDMPYDVMELHQKRQRLRDKINELGG